MMNDWDELYPESVGPLGIGVLGDEFENPNQPWRRNDHATVKIDMFTNPTVISLMRSWGMSEEQIAAEAEREK